MIYGGFKDRTIVETVSCSRRAVAYIRTNLKCYGTTQAPRPRVGRPRIVTPPMREALLEYLVEKPDLY